SEANCGVVTDKVRLRLEALGAANPGKWIMADSRERIGLFRGAWLKPNQGECLRATGAASVETAAIALAERAGRPVFCTEGEKGTVIAGAEPASVRHVPGYSVTGAIDPVGAGDTTSAGIICALASGQTRESAAAFGNLVASITIQQLGTTGTASPQQVRER